MVILFFRTVFPVPVFIVVIFCCTVLFSLIEVKPKYIKGEK